MIYVEAPDRTVKKGMPSVFLAGGITGAPQWQNELIASIHELDMVIYNPRRANFPIKDPSAAEKQIKWEYDMLRVASMISFWFCKETMCPIVLLELGSHLMTSKPLVVGMDKKYQRRQDVEIQTDLARSDVKIVYSLDDLADEVSKLYNQLKMTV